MKAARKYVRKCKNCGRKLVKNGQENTKQRWRCLSCGTARIHRRSDTIQRNRAMVRRRYLLSKQSTNELAAAHHISRSTFNRLYLQEAQCVVREHYRGQLAVHTNYLVIDATSLSYGIVAIAKTEQERLHWNFAAYESSDVWIRTLSSFNRVRALVSDGQKGIQKAALICYGENLIMQRCHFHIKQNIRAKLTRNPKTEAGQDLSLLMSWLCRVREYDQMALFVGVFNGLHEAYGVFLLERTYYITTNGKRRWSYTHKQVRSAYRQIADLIQTDQSFAYITHPELMLPNTTNQIEGGLNARLQELIRSHRGLLPERQRDLVNAFLHSKSIE